MGLKKSKEHISNNGTAENGFGISEEEKAQLLAEIDKFKEDK